MVCSSSAWPRTAPEPYECCKRCGPASPPHPCSPPTGAQDPIPNPPTAAVLPWVPPMAPDKDASSEAWNEWAFMATAEHSKWAEMLFTNSTSPGTTEMLLDMGMMTLKARLRPPLP